MRSPQRPPFLIGLLVAAIVTGCSSTVRAEPQPFELYTHCGLDRSQIAFDGSFWQAEGPGPLSDGSGNPPPGFDNPFDRGTITRTGEHTAVFVSSAGIEVELARLDARPDLVPCR